MTPPTERADIALPREVARYLHTSEAALAQLRYRGCGPRFVRLGRKVLYRWSDVREYLAANTFQRTDDRHPVP
ncbi:helix-turn-helix domain-containing protein [Mycobacterium sp.]|uniref:helix-turn-helix transcriptional regulator n=1 Tax=Mycobacterium sp. TaxID=1785 RepID=UPI0031D0357D